MADGFSIITALHIEIIFILASAGIMLGLVILCIM